MYSLAIGGLGEISIQSLRMLFSQYIWNHFFLLSKVPTLRFLSHLGPFSAKLAVDPSNTIPLAKKSNLWNTSVLSCSMGKKIG